LAERAGVTQAAIARIEKGTRVPSVSTVERLLAAMGLQLAIGVEPLDAHVDAAIDRIADTPLADRIADTDIDSILQHLTGIPYAFDGAAAALLQGAPVPVDAVYIAVAWADSEAFTDWLANSYGHRWNELSCARSAG
jgi:transcriptional regulator with XRE-family HTH domain